MPLPTRRTDLIADIDGERLDVFVARSIAGDDTVARAEADRRTAWCSSTGEPAASVASARSPGSAVSVTVPDGARERGAGRKRIALDIIYEDADIIAINKPPGMTVHPSPGHTSTRRW